MPLVYCHLVLKRKKKEKKKFCELDATITFR